MRTPLERALGTGSYLTLRGKQYHCKPLRMKHFAEAKAFLASLIPDPVKELADEKDTFTTFPPEIQKALAIRALEMREERRVASAAESSLWVNSEEGVLFLFWCMIRDQHPEFATLQSLLVVFPPGEEKALTIPECDLIKQKLDEVTLDGALAKKKPIGEDSPAPLRNPKKKKKNSRR